MDGRQPRRGNARGDRWPWSGRIPLAAGRTRDEWGSVQEFNCSGLRPFLTLPDLHPHTLAFCQRGQPAALERRGMDENILPTAILAYETNPLSALYHLTEPMHSSVVPMPGCRGRPERGAERRSVLLVT